MRRILESKRRNININITFSYNTISGRATFIYLCKIIVYSKLDGQIKDREGFLIIVGKVIFVMIFRHLGMISK